MSMIDGEWVFDTITGEAITTARASTNIVRLDGPGDIGIGKALYVTVGAQTTFTSGTAAATLTIALQAAPKNGANPGEWFTIQQSPAFSLGQLVAGNIIFETTINPIVELNSTSVNTTGSSSTTTITVTDATGIKPGMFVVGGTVVPGTTVVSISSLAVTISVATGSTDAAGTEYIFTTQYPKPSYYRLYYTPSNDMTAGKVFAYASLGRDRNISYGTRVPPILGSI